MYWVNSQKYDVVAEFHLDSAGASATGGHVIVSSKFKADNIDKTYKKLLRII